ncbi:tol-pal system protein YbgF [Roseicyclus persicicus]|uniref:Cell division coordinator CpoB n=1 Tax=Roseicyclus persicicus TaxID=2650661 RepID=A0A7X6JYJ7_9RHOB|nr:tol-pal system protein YbgF [Roseibacterium persicicum]NKX44170.1 tol-pal system protein YbgF [Roseibacterium persicicum]
MRRVLVLALCLGLSAPAAVAQDRTQTLADIRQELSVLFVELQRLRGELNTTGGAMGSGGGGTVLSRVDAIEAELRRLNALTEELQIRIDRVVTDGTNRVGDLEFRLCELTPDCRIGDIGQTAPLGGVPVQQGATAVAPSAPAAPGGANLAVAEQSDFDRARAAYEAADYAQAAQLFEAFTLTYPGGPLSAEAHFLRGQAEAQQGQWSRAARAYLDSFTADTQGMRAPGALLNLGIALGELGQRDEACVTLAEVGGRYPGNPAVAEAQAARARLGCS